MVAKVQYGNLASPTTETKTISIRIIDEINFPAYLVAKFVNRASALDTRYNTSDEIRVIEDDITDDPTIFRGKVENVLKSVENGVEIITITARDNLTELDMPFNSTTYSQNGADATINAIIRGHVKTITDKIDLPAVDSNTAAYQSSLFTNAVSVIGETNGRSVLRTIQDLAAEDAWHGTLSSVTNTGWHFYLDGGVDMHYHQIGAYPSAPIGDGLRLKHGLAAGSVSDFYKQVLPTPSYSTFDTDIVSEVYAHYQKGSEAKVVRLKLITFTSYDNSGGPFAAGNNISGTAEGGSGTATAQIRAVLSGALLVSHSTDYTAEAPNFNPGVTITDATSGATATYTTTSGQETDKAQPVHLRRSTLVFASSTADATILQTVSRIAYATARAGFIDISADTHRKASIKVFDFPIFRRSSTTTVVRAGNQIYLEDALTNPSSAVAENFTVSKIEYVQDSGKSISTLSLTTNEGSPLRLTGVERVGSIAKDSGIEAQVQFGEGVSTAKMTAADGTAALPSVTFDGSDSGHTGIFLHESGSNEYLGLTADGVISAYFGEDGAGIWFYESVNAVNDITQTLGTASYRWRDIYCLPSSTTTGTDLIVTAAGLFAKKSSSIQYKDNVKALDFDSSKLDNLRPVSYTYKFDDAPDIGLIAEEVNEVYPELVNYNEEGKPESVKYDGLSVMLLDEVKALRQEIKELREKN